MDNNLVLLFLYDLQIIYLQLLIYVMLKNNNHKNNNIKGQLTMFKYELRRRRVR